MKRKFNRKYYQVTNHYQTLYLPIWATWSIFSKFKNNFTQLLGAKYLHGLNVVHKKLRSFKWICPNSTHMCNCVCIGMLKSPSTHTLHMCAQPIHNSRVHPWASIGGHFFFWGGGGTPPTHFQSGGQHRKCPPPTFLPIKRERVSYRAPFDPFSPLITAIFGWKRAWLTGLRVGSPWRAYNAPPRPQQWRAARCNSTTIPSNGPPPTLYHRSTPLRAPHARAHASAHARMQTRVGCDRLNTRLNRCTCRCASTQSCSTGSKICLPVSAYCFSTCCLQASEGICWCRQSTDNIISFPPSNTLLPPLPWRCLHHGNVKKRQWLREANGNVLKRSSTLLAIYNVHKQDKILNATTKF